MGVFAVIECVVAVRVLGGVLAGAGLVLAAPAAWLYRREHRKPSPDGSALAVSGAAAVAAAAVALLGLGALIADPPAGAGDQAGRADRLEGEVARLAAGLHARDAEVAALRRANGVQERNLARYRERQAALVRTTDERLSVLDLAIALAVVNRDAQAKLKDLRRQLAAEPVVEEK